MAENPTTRLLRQLANEPELVVDGGRIPVSLDLATELLLKVADWLDDNRKLEETT